jgi:hypothetical protein
VLIIPSLKAAVYGTVSPRFTKMCITNFVYMNFCDKVHVLCLAHLKFSEQNETCANKNTNYATLQSVKLGEGHESVCCLLHALC